MLNFERRQQQSHFKAPYLTITVRLALCIMTLYIFPIINAVWFSIRKQNYWFSIRSFSINYGQSLLNKHDFPKSQVQGWFTVDRRKKKYRKFHFDSQSIFLAALSSVLSLCECVAAFTFRYSFNNSFSSYYITFD